MAWIGKCPICGSTHVVTFGSAIRCCGRQHEQLDCSPPTMRDLKRDAEQDISAQPNE